jgi:hypothetical protein
MKTWLNELVWNGLVLLLAGAGLVIAVGAMKVLAHVARHYL